MLVKILPESVMQVFLLPVICVQVVLLEVKCVAIILNINVLIEAQVGDYFGQGLDIDNKNKSVYY